MPIKSRYLLVAMALSACSANGPIYSDANIPHGTGSTIVVYRPSSILQVARRFPLEINGVEKCSLSNGGYFAETVVPGKIGLTSSMWDQPGTSRAEIMASANQTSYVSIRLNNDKTAAGIGGGMIGLLIAEGSSSTSGPFIFSNVPESQALKELADLKQDCM